jgi:hypothetical protein
MTRIPEPQVGMVINYEYIWARQFKDGFKPEDRVKVRPCAILAVVEGKDDVTVYVSPMTHTAPYQPERSIKLSDDTSARLRMDCNNSWLMVDEVNKFTWPGDCLRRVFNREKPSYCYGMLPETVLLDARSKMKAFNANKVLSFVPRDQQAAYPAMRAG